LEDQEVYAATFDIPQVLVTELVSAMGVEAGVLAPAREVKKQIFMQPRTLRLACTLGDIQKFAGDAFVPLSVTKIGVHEIESERRPN